jgi:hypothetical protein
VVAAEVTATTNDQTQFVPMATAVKENLPDAGHEGEIGVFLADAGYWSAANGAWSQVLLRGSCRTTRCADRCRTQPAAVEAKTLAGKARRSRCSIGTSRMAMTHNAVQSTALPHESRSANSTGAIASARPQLVWNSAL